MSSIVADPTTDVDVNVNVVSQDSLPAENPPAETTKVASASASAPTPTSEPGTGPSFCPPSPQSADLQLLWTGGDFEEDKSVSIFEMMRDYDAYPFPATTQSIQFFGRWYVEQVSSAIIQHKIPRYIGPFPQMEFLIRIAGLFQESHEASISSAVVKANSEMQVDWKIREEEETADQERAERKKAKQRLEDAKQMHLETKDDAEEAGGHGGDESEAAIMKSIIDAMQKKVDDINQAGRKDDMRLARKKWLGFVTTFLADAETVLNELEGFDKQQPIGLPSPENSQDA